MVQLAYNGFWCCGIISQICCYMPATANWQEKAETVYRCKNKVNI